MNCRTLGYDYYIACKNCQRFLDLGRWRVFHDVQFPRASKTLFQGAGNVAAASIDGVHLRERLRRMDDPFSVHCKDEPEFHRLVALLTQFCDDHERHELYFINDSGDFPWVPCDGFQWYEWAEVIGPITDLRRVDLPKNLVHDLHLRSWNEVEKHLLGSPSYDPAAFPGGIALVKYGFDKVQNG